MCIYMYIKKDAQVLRIRQLIIKKGGMEDIEKNGKFFQKILKNYQKIYLKNLD